jgi:hypothetical protein
VACHACHQASGQPLGFDIEAVSACGQSGRSHLVQPGYNFRIPSKTNLDLPQILAQLRLERERDHPGIGLRIFSRRSPTALSFCEVPCGVDHSHDFVVAAMVRVISLRREFVGVIEKATRNAWLRGGGAAPAMIRVWGQVVPKFRVGPGSGQNSRSC